MQKYRFGETPLEEFMLALNELKLKLKITFTFFKGGDSSSNDSIIM